MIEVTIPSTVLIGFPNDIHVGMVVLERLRAAGVPARGDLWPLGVSEGRLSSEFDSLTEDLVYRWEPA